MVVTLHSLADVTLDAAWQVGFENSSVALSDGVKARIGECREAFERLLASDDAGFVYGVYGRAGRSSENAAFRRKSEGVGEFAEPVGPEELSEAEIDGYPSTAVRLVLLARVAGYIEGHGRVTVGTAEWVAGRLSEPAPAMPLDTATGTG